MTRLPPRFPLATLPTPLVPARRLAATGPGRLLVKRDDLVGFAVAGNKARALEYLVGAAIDFGARVLVTGGGPGSNFCAAAAVAARVADLECELVVWGDPGAAPNMRIARAAGARILPTGDDDRDAVDVLVAERAAELSLSGRKAYAVPRGGSTAIGALGFADAARELVAQLAALDDRPSAIVLPVGSGGSCAGLLSGLAEAGCPVPVVGVSVSRPPAAVREHVLALARQCSVLRGAPPPRPGQLELVDARGPGFGSLTPQERERCRTALHTEGFLLDATYGAEAFSVALDLCHDRPGPVVWWHTGGVAAAIDRLGRPEGVPVSTSRPRLEEGHGTP